MLLLSIYSLETSFTSDSYPNQNTRSASSTTNMSSQSFISRFWDFKWFSAL